MKYSLNVPDGLFVVLGEDEDRVKLLELLLCVVGGGGDVGVDGERWRTVSAKVEGAVNDKTTHTLSGFIDSPGIKVAV